VGVLADAGDNNGKQLDQKLPDEPVKGSKVKTKRRRASREATRKLRPIKRTKRNGGARRKKGFPNLSSI